ncbi:helix-turn-helix transcriptional regulator [Oscillibacter sp.]|uniref:helix-turn-helix domain-containing protein n=1 Tax=Oscillibacter sp. TaxID=1945593 RepID=UPI00289F150C|nr:helix-turn-helix transcriptional regulator [Oscillibacter sp.]
MFYDRFYKLCQSAGVTPAKVAEDLELNKSTVYMWKRQKTTPKVETLKKLAAYFRTTEDYLLGKAASPEDGSPVFTFFDKDGNAHFRKGPEEEMGLVRPYAYIGTIENVVFTQIDVQRLNVAFTQLNLMGRQEAVKRVEELTVIPKYQKEKDSAQPE